MRVEWSSVRWAWALPAVGGAVLTVAVVLVVGLVADDDDEVAGLPRSAASARTPPSTAPNSSGAATAVPSGDPVTRLHLRGDGLDMVGFGDAQLDVTRTLTDVLGAPDEQSDEPCAGHPEHQAHWVRWADLSIRFDAGRFVGWIEGIHVPPGSPPVDLPTGRGLSPGDPLARAQQLYPGLRVRHTASPGQQEADIFTFYDPDGAPKMFGAVEGNGDDALVASIFSGDLC